MVRWPGFGLVGRGPPFRLDSRVGRYHRFWLGACPPFGEWVLGPPFGNGSKKGCRSQFRLTSRVGRAPLLGLGSKVGPGCPFGLRSRVSSGCVREWGVGLLSGSVHERGVGPRF